LARDVNYRQSRIAAAAQPPQVETEFAGILRAICTPAQETTFCRLQTIRDPAMDFGYHGDSMCMRQAILAVLARDANDHCIGLDRFGRDRPEVGQRHRQKPSTPCHAAIIHKNQISYH
jgi:hypothetical protein